MKWFTININANQVETATGRASKIKMPNSSEYQGYVFWFPTKLIGYGRHSAAYEIRFPRTFEFKLKKYGKGKHNSYSVISEIEVDYETILEAFKVTDENIEPEQYAPNTIQEHHIPPVLNADDLPDEADTSLMREE